MSPSAETPAATAPNSPVTYLFVYGTLRRAYMLLPQPLRRMRPPHVLDTHGRWVGTAVLHGHMLWDVGKYPGMLKSAQKGARVVGDVFDVAGAEDKWPVLDRYEGIAEEFEHPREYRREIAEIELDGEEGEEKRIVPAWVYMYNWPVNEQKWTLVPDGDYVKHAAMTL